MHVSQLILKQTFAFHSFATPQLSRPGNGASQGESPTSQTKLDFRWGTACKWYCRGQRPPDSSDLKPMHVLYPLGMKKYRMSDRTSAAIGRSRLDRCSNKTSQCHKTFSHEQTAAKLHSFARATPCIPSLCHTCEPAFATMGGGRGRARYTSAQPKGKGLGASPTPRAVAKDSTVHLDILRAFPGEDVSILLHRQGTRSDGQVLEKQCLVQLLTKDTHELLNRPSKGLSMLCGSMTHGLVALQRLDTTLRQNDREALQSALDSLGSACAALDSTKKKEPTPEEISTAIQQAFSFLTHAESASFQRLAVLAAQLYVTAMQLLEARKQQTVATENKETYCM